MEPVTFIFSLAILLTVLLSIGLALIAYNQGETFTRRVKESYKEELRLVKRF